MRVALPLVILPFLALACGSSTAPAAPTPAPATLKSVAITANVASLNAIGQTAQATATGTFSDGTSRDLTSTCTNWLSDTPAVLTVNGTGLSTARGTGPATITTSCQSIPASAAMTVTLRRTTFTVSGTAVDGYSGGVLPNIAVQVMDGDNAELTARTDGAGNYVVSGLHPGTFTVSFSAISYYTATKTITVSADTRIDITLQRAPTLGASRLDIELRYDWPAPCLPTATPRWVVHAAGSLTATGDTFLFSQPDSGWATSMQALKLAFTLAGTRVTGTIGGRASVIPVPFVNVPSQQIEMDISSGPISSATFPVPVTGVFLPQGGFSGVFHAQVWLGFFDLMFNCEGTYQWTLGLQ